MLCGCCGSVFPHLRDDTSLCKKCERLDAVVSAEERSAIEAEPQCTGCSVTFKYLKNARCGVCIDKDKGLDSRRIETTGQSILDRSIEYQRSASEHRLNQPAGRQNHALQAASATKERLNAIKKQNKADTITIEMLLFIFPSGGGPAKKTQLLPILRKVLGSDLASDVFQYAKTELKKALIASPASHLYNIALMNFVEPTFGVANCTKVHYINPEEIEPTGTVEAMFNWLKSEAKLAEGDIKARNIPLRVYVYETRPESEDEDVEPILSKRSSIRLRSTASRARTVGAKRKASGSFSSTAQYTSSFRPQKKVATSSTAVRAIQYDYYQFTQTALTFDNAGKICEHISVEEKTIKISRNWRANIGDMPKDGYIAAGLVKNAFLGDLNGKMFAIFQCRPERSTEYQNLIDLTAELHLLAYGQYFAESFSRRASAMGIEVPSICWNFHDAFIGTVTSGLEPEPLDGELDLRSLSFNVFLAAPYLTTAAPYVERKFSGSDEAGNNVDSIGRAIDAYAHHVLVDSSGTLLMTDIQGIISPDKKVILFDPQAHSSYRNTGFWDGGATQMREWVKNHKCKTLCRKLGLKGAVVNIESDEEEVIIEPEIEEPVPRAPLRHGFSPKRELSE